MKVAVCISGQMRTFRKAYSSLIKHVINPYKADVFIDTWSNTGNTNKLILFFPAGFGIKLPKDYWHSEPDVISHQKSLFEISFPNLYNKLQVLAAADDRISREELIDIYSPQAVRIEDFDIKLFDSINIDEISKKFPDRTGMNALPMFYKIFYCNQLRMEYEKKAKFLYDVVIRTRPDLYFHEDLIIDKENIKNKLFTLYNPYYEILGVEETNSNDMFFIGDSNTATYASSIWEKLSLYWDPKYMPERPFADRGPERILNDHLRERNLNDAIIHVKPQPSRVAYSISMEELINCLYSDLCTNGRLPLFIKSCVALAQSAFAVEKYVTGDAHGATDCLAKPISVGSFECEEPHVGRAKIAQLQGNNDAMLYHVTLAREADQQGLFPELFTI